MSGLGSFDRTGSISKGLTSAALTYGGGQIARGIGEQDFKQDLIHLTQRL
jgi:hypothetical protein